MSRSSSAWRGALVALPGGTRATAPAIRCRGRWRAVASGVAAARPHAGNGPYGPMGAPHVSGVALPEGFSGGWWPGPGTRWPG